MSETILGISAFYHDSAAALLINGEIIAAAQEERFTRKKHDSAFPVNAVNYVLHEGGLETKNLDAIAFYDKPYLKFERLLETYHAFAPRGLKSFLSAIPVWIKEKLFIKRIIRAELGIGDEKKPVMFFPEHHLSHAASAFYPSPFDEAAILTLDGVGEWATTTIGYGKGNTIQILKELSFPHSLGLIYSAFTYYCGFKVNNGEYKLMGLAPYGDSGDKQLTDLKQKILDEIIDVREDGSFLLNMDYFNYATGLTMCHEKRWEKLFGIPRRKPETELNREYMNLALAIQEITEDIVIRLAKSARELTSAKYLSMAGGVALNCVANGKLLKSGMFEDIWIQPASGDAGGALGAAYAVCHIVNGRERNVSRRNDAMFGAYLGPDFNSADVTRIARKYSAQYKMYEQFDRLCNDVAEFLAQGNVVGWFQGRLEYGPRALGNRSIIADPRNSDMQKKLNLKIKYRESFRPFAPSVLEEDIQQYFELDRPSPYMLLVAPVNHNRRNPLPGEKKELSMYDILYHIRSDIPAVTHVDYSARIHSVNKEINSKFWKLINTFKEKTGYGVIVNTSFNVRGEPIVCNPEDAYICFMRTEMDYLVINNIMFIKTEQKKMFELDMKRDNTLLD